MPTCETIKPVPKEIQAGIEAFDNPLDRAVQQAAGELALMRMTRLCRVACPDQDEAESLADDIRQIIKTVDNMLAAIGAEASAHFGHIDKKLFVDQLSDAMEGNGIYELLSAVEAERQQSMPWWRGRAA